MTRISFNVYVCLVDIHNQSLTSMVKNQDIKGSFTLWAWFLIGGGGLVMFRYFTCS